MATMMFRAETEGDGAGNKIVRLRQILLASAVLIILLQIEVVWDNTANAAGVLPKVVVMQHHRELNAGSSAATSSSHNHNNCQLLRGEAGQWIQDWEYAKRANHQFQPVKGPHAAWHAQARNLRPTPETPFRWSTTWRWQDEACPVQELSSLDAFCRVSWQLNLTRFLFLGDSMSMQTMVSLLSLVGRPPVEREYSAWGINQPFYLPCSFSLVADEEDPSSASSREMVEFNMTLGLFQRKPFEDWVTLKQQLATNTTHMNGTTNS
jgi:hypothetical protein